MDLNINKMCLTTFFCSLSRIELIFQKRSEIPPSSSAQAQSREAKGGRQVGLKMRCVKGAIKTSGNTWNL